MASRRPGGFARAQSSSASQCRRTSDLRAGLASYPRTYASVGCWRAIFKAEDRSVGCGACGHQPLGHRIAGKTAVHYHKDMHFLPHSVATNLLSMIHQLVPLSPNKLPCVANDETLCDWGRRNEQQGSIASVKMPPRVIPFQFSSPRVIQ
jgi:hypothetical protein